MEKQIIITETGGKIITNGFGFNILELIGVFEYLRVAYVNQITGSAGQSQHSGTLLTGEAEAIAANLKRDACQHVWRRKKVNKKFQWNCHNCGKVSLENPRMK